MFLQASLAGHTLALAGAIHGVPSLPANSQTPLHVDLSNVHACSPAFASSAPVQLSEARSIVPIFSGYNDGTAGCPVGLGAVMQGSADIQQVVIIGDLVAFQKQANHARQIGILERIEWPAEPPQPCSRQDPHLKLSLISVASASPAATSHYQLSPRHVASRVAFSAVTSSAAVLPAEEYAAVFPIERFASAAATCLKDEGGEVWDRIRTVVGAGETSPPAWRRLALLVQAAAGQGSIQSAMCM